MSIEFFKYQGTGNDFVLIDNRLENFNKKNTKLVAAMCDRKFGIGADGLLLLENHPEADFNMVYYNSDGNLSSMCGNGGRCITHFAMYLGVIKKDATFEAVDGMHHATILNDKISLGMNDVEKVSVFEEYVFLNTGSPHHVQLVSNLDEFNVFSEGRRIRNEVYGRAGANVNFVEQVSDNTFKVRTYERGVEDETLSCGTGVGAVAIAMFETGKTVSQSVCLETPGGTLEVQFQKEGGSYKNIKLIGPAVQVFKGVWE
ncbi:diaminopimelate epimerase [Aureisphaera sp. CAU 1614]|uniref:Diaminopimelate epimerase n=1 Tax=Halomarinibacterium sedimenti TaxID=2857106 RepID=A0A9X1FQ12_9FLAO|nr:diaminopimelate epimerase [Halomarinibacterium sedimenti]MBW2938415.1 diaminopimelate epimerase [Halomarinibacterium sedimenti]